MLGHLVGALQCSDKIYIQFKKKILARSIFFLVRDKTGLVGKKSHSAAITLDSLKWKQLIIKHMPNWSYTGMFYSKNTEE